MPPFENKEISKKKGLKINNENSSVPAPKPDNKVVFNEQAQKAATKYEEYKQRTWELSTRFKSMVEDRVLSDNKSPLSKGIESETLNKLVALACEMNEDDNQPEGIGSTALSFLMMKMLLVQRDTINGLLFKIDRLEKSVSKLEAKQSSESDKDK